MEPITDPSKYPVVIHGSYAKNWHSIYHTGLNKMKRNHIRTLIRLENYFRYGCWFPWRRGSH